VLSYRPRARITVIITVIVNFKINWCRIVIRDVFMVRIWNKIKIN